MDDKSIPGNLQNDFFNQARRDRARVTVFLNSGKKLTGRIKGFDRFTIILDGPGGEQMIFKHAIATVNTSKTFGNYIDVEGAMSKRGRGEGPATSAAPAAATTTDAPPKESTR